MVNLMFIRFVCRDIDEDSHVSAGLFCAAYDLIDEAKLPDHDFAELADLMRWFRLPEGAIRTSAPEAMARTTVHLLVQVRCL